MTNTTDLRTRALSTLVSAPARDTAAQRHNAYATVAVSLPDGTTGQARSLDVAAATMPGAEPTWHVAVQQGKRVDLWHVSQLA